MRLEILEKMAHREQRPAQENDLEFRYTFMIDNAGKRGGFHTVTGNLFAETLDDALRLLKSRVLRSGGSGREVSRTYADDRTRVDVVFNDGTELTLEIRGTQKKAYLERLVGRGGPTDAR